MNLASALLQGLKAYGVQEIFGIPGDFALPFFKVIEESKILPLYTLSHEPAVGFAADAAARFLSKPSCAVVTYGAGAFNMLNAVATAYAEKSPLVVISGGPGIAEQKSGWLVHHQAKHLSSQREVYKEVTCFQVVLDDLSTAPARIAGVLKNCIINSRPVYIEIPRDLVFAPCAPVPQIDLQSHTDEEALAACTDEILACLSKAKAPVLMVGVEVRRFGLEALVTELSQKLGFPVVTTFMGRGLLAGQPVDLKGTYLGIAGDEKITALVENSDALFMLGIILSDTNFAVSAKKINVQKSILVCDNQVKLGYHTYANIAIADLVGSLNKKLATLKKGQAIADNYPRGLCEDEAAISPTDIATAINDCFDKHGAMPIAADMGDCLFTALDVEYTDLVAPGYYATMGFGVPAGLGIQAATGRRPLILVGDGAFQMTGWELLNCKRYGWNPIVVVFNNSSWEMLRVFQPESAFNDLVALDFAAIARALGGSGCRVQTRRELKQALADAVRNTQGFQLVDAVLAKGVLSNTLFRYVSGVKNSRGG